uniref:Galactose mutarotase n=1 Tax=Heterorhabditis bacteriophora TaxID=37862 RepID=A0A1I7XNG9_HETBA
MKMILKTINKEKENGMQVELLNFGATIRSILVPDREGRMIDVVLGYNNVKEYEQDSLSLGSTIGRVAGRIRNGKYAIDSREYFVAQNKFPHHCDGGAKSPLSKKVWNYCLMEEGNGIIFTVRSHDGDEGYPGNAIIQMSCVLTNHNELLVQFSASTDKSTLMNLSNNIYFNLNGELEGNERIFRDQVWMSMKSRSVLQAICLLKTAELVYSTQTGIDMNITTTQNCVLFDCGSQLKGVQGKKGNIYQFGSSFLVGCRGFEDACNQPSFPSISLRKDQLYQHITVYGFSLLKNARI